MSPTPPSITPAGWTVLDRDAGVLTREYSFAKGGLARTFAARMPDGSMIVVSPSTDLTEAQASELAAFGPVEALVPNNGFHYLGLAGWRARFPDARGFAAPAAAARIGTKSPDAGVLEPLTALGAPDDALRVHAIPDSKLGETWGWVRTDQGYVWFVSALLINMPRLPEAFVPRQLFRLTGSAPGYRVFHLMLAFAVRDKKAALRGLLDDMTAHPPAMIVPAHGDVLSGEGLLEQTRAVIEAAL